MHAIIRITLLLLLFAGLTSSAFSRGRGIRENVEWKDVPIEVQTTIQANASGGTVRSVEKRSRRGEVTFTADVKGTDGKLTEIEVNSNGRLISIEHVDPSDDHSD